MAEPGLGTQHGFVHALCTCGRTDQWLTCNACGKSDRFELLDDGAACACGARYSHATCACGTDVPRARLEWVAWNKGPAQLADWELDPVRTAIVALVAVGVLGAAALLLWRAFG